MVPRAVEIYTEVKDMQYVLLILGLVFLSFLMCLPVALLWNGCLVPAVTVCREITWLQAWGLAILCNLLLHSKAESK